jgi:hypothetical protein
LWAAQFIGWCIKISALGKSMLSCFFWFGKWIFPRSFKAWLWNCRWEFRELGYIEGLLVLDLWSWYLAYEVLD